MDNVQGVSRRSFLKRASLLGVAGVGAAALSGCTGQGSSSGKADYLPDAWEEEADIIVVGYGGAGAAAAITSAMEDLGSCIVLEAAPEGEEGGNSRVCGQNMLIPDDIESAMKYQKSLNGDYTISDDPEEEDALYRAWATELSKNKEWLESLGATVTATNMNSHEFPEVDGNELGATCYLIDNTVGNQALWNVLKEQEENYDINVRYATRATELVRNPDTNEVLGVMAEQDGKTVYYKANKGVVLSCGGFENAPEMVKNNCVIGSAWDMILGTPYNRGDGFKMVAPFGADLWHMNNTAGPTWGYSACGEDKPYGWSASPSNFATKDFIYVGPSAERFMNEEFANTSRHGKFNYNSTYQPDRFNTPSYTIFGQKAFESGDIIKPFTMGWANLVDSYVAEGNQGFLDAGVIKKADTIEELAKLIGLDPEQLAKTVTTYNEYCAAGKDPDYKRGEPILQSMAVLSSQGQSSEDVKSGETAATAGFTLEPIEAPFYAIKMRCSIGANTQGGPRRGTGGEVKDVKGNPVQRLYAAGEFGSIYSYMYNGGGNVSEAMSSGRIAVRSIGALSPWDTK